MSSIKLESNASGTGIFTIASPNSNSNQTLNLPNSSGTILTSTFPGPSAGISWQSVQTGNFTAVAGRGYPVNTTSASITVTLPATPSVGDVVWLVDYAGTWDTNPVVLARNGSNILGSAANSILAQDREGVGLVYVDATQGWIPYSGFNTATPVNTITVDYLVIAGGGAGTGLLGGGGGAGGYRTSAGTSGGGASAESALTLNQATNYTVTVGAGAPSPANSVKANGSNSVFSTITSTGGGGSGYYDTNGIAGNTGGSGGAGGVAENGAPGDPGSGTANQGYAAGASGNRGGSGLYPGAGGGGGAGAVGNANTGGKGGTGGVGGAGVSSSITGSPVTRGGGGGGSGYNGTGGAGGSGGGGAGASGESGNATNGTANTGGGGGGRGGTTVTGGAGGSGVVILRYPSYFTISNPGGGLTYTTSTSAGLTVAIFTAGTGNVQWN